MIKSRKRSRNDFKTMIIGLIILIICLIACIFHISDLYGSYKDNLKKEFSSKLIDIQNNLEIYTAKLEVQSTKLSNDLINSEPSEYGTKIEEFMVQYMNNFFSSVFFISKDYKIYDYSGEIRIQILTVPAEELLSYQKNTFWFGSLINGRRDVISAIIPVCSGDEVIGVIITENKVSDTLAGNADAYLRENGTYMVINSELERLWYNGVENNPLKGTDYVDSDIIHDSGDRVNTKADIEAIKRKLKNKNSFTYQYSSLEEDVIQVMGYYLEDFDDCYIVGIYNEDNLLFNIKPIILRSVLTCSFIIFLMISLIIYVWASGKFSNIMIEKLAYEDTVTSGKNTNYFRDKAIQIINANREAPYISQRFDICNFRYINEAYGHNRADEVLTACIRLAKKFFSDKELVVRMDSDQFLALNINDTEVDQKRSNYVSAVNEYARSIGVKYPVRFKFGVYQIRKQDLDIDLIIDRANVARKSLDGDEKKLIAYYSDTIVQNMRKIDKIESEMNNALKNGEFHVYLQPKWDIMKDTLAGAEALVRWIKVDGTVVFPASFIPIFENNGFIEKLDFYMLETVCKEMKKRIDAGLKVCPVSINQSRLLMHNPEYVNNVAKILRNYNIPRKYIELELTETVFADDRNKMIEMMNQLKEQHVRLSMDDFGSGYSSLNLLKDIPFDILKIDREFFSEAITSESSSWILQKIIEMAEGLGIEVICEGVETEEQIEILKKVGCHLVQGFYYSKPISIAEFIQKYG